MDSREAARTIMAAVRRRAISPQRAAHYVREHAEGRDISVLSALAVPLGMPEVTDAGWAQVSDALASLPTGAVGVSDLDWIAMFGATSPREAETLAAAREARQQELASVPESELYEALFNASTNQGHEEHPSRTLVHEPATVTHKHKHSAYSQSGDQVHEHSHTHGGDANHDHH